MTGRFLSPTPIADDYVAALQSDLDGARLVRFVMAYVTSSGLQAIGTELLARALRQEGSLGVASLACACGFEPLLALQDAVGSGSSNLRYFLDPGVADASDPNVALLHSKLVYIVRGDGSVVVYMGSHNWSGRALGGGSARNTEASFRVELEFDERHLSGTGSDLGAEVNRHILASYDLGACLPATPDNRPVFEDWFRVRCQRPADLDLDSYAVVLGICDEVNGSRDPAFWLARAARGASIYLQCHEEDEGSVVRKRQERVLLMLWVDRAAFAQARPPVLLFCKVTRQSAGEDSTYEGTSGGDITNFGFVLWDPDQNAARATGDRVAPRRQAPTRTGRRFEHFLLQPAPAGATASQFDRAAPRYQHYLQVYELVLPAWIASEASSPDHGAAPLVWAPESFALSSTRKVPPEESRLYRAPEDVAARIVGCLQEQFGLDMERAVALPTSAETDPRKLVRAVENPLHDACIDADTEAMGDAFYARAPAGSIAMQLQVGSPQPSHGDDVVPRVQELFGERLRTLLVRLGVEHPDVEEWERKPKVRREEPGSRAPRERVQDQAEGQSRKGAAASTRSETLADAVLLEALRAAIQDERPRAGDTRTRDEITEAVLATACRKLGRSGDDAEARPRLEAMLKNAERKTRR